MEASLVLAGREREADEVESLATKAESEARAVWPLVECAGQLVAAEKRETLAAIRRGKRSGPRGFRKRNDGDSRHGGLGERGREGYKQRESREHEKAASTHVSGF
jgi:hypothetical protein